MKPLRDLILIKPIVRQLSQTIIVENRESYNDAEVISVGPDAREVKAGDRIRYGNGDYLKWDLVEIDGEKYQVISEADVAAIVEAA